MWNERDEQHAQGARQALRETADSTKQQAGAVFHDQRDRVAGGAHAVADALRSSADSLRQSDSASVAGYFDQAAHRVEDLSRRLREEDFGSLMHTAQDYARRQPAVFLGASVAAGLALGRFLKSSSGRRERMAEPDTGYRPASTDMTPRYDGPAVPVRDGSPSPATSEFLEY